MAGKPKRSIDFAGWRTDIFENDTKIDELIDAQGWIGFAIYFYLCQKAYASDGYFYRWSYSNAATTARRMGGGIGSETIRQVVGLCLQIGLFDKRLFDREGILTSRGIQRRYVVAIQKRSFREVDEKLWLLNLEESEGLIVVPKNKDSLPEDVHSLPENGTESKVKKSKVKESKEEGTAPPSPSSAYDDLVKDYGKEEADKYIRKVEDWFKERNRLPGDVCATARKWLEKDGYQKLERKYDFAVNKF